MPWVEGGKRILEDHLHAPPQRTELLVVEVRDVLAVEEHLAAGRLVEAQDRAADRRLAAARLADQAERLAAADLERDAVDGLDVADVAVEDDPALDREVELQVLELDQGAVLAHDDDDRPRSSCHSSSGTGLKHATACPGSISTSGGTSSRDWSTS